MIRNTGGLSMAIPDLNLTESQLRIYNGEDQERMYVAYAGIVYDVTDCPRWGRGLHADQHFPGQELTQALNENAPHTGGVFSHPCVTIIGRLIPIQNEEGHP